MHSDRKALGQTLVKQKESLLWDTHVQSLLPGLSHPVAASLRLFVIVRVAVDIVNDDHIGWSQVNAQSSGSGGQQEHKYILVCVELVNQLNSVKAQWDLQLLSIYLIGIY